VDSSIAGLLNATTPLCTALIAMAVRLERDVTPTRIAGLAVGFLGTLVIFEPWRLGSQVLSWGGLACLVAAACYGVSFVYMARYLRRPELSPLALSAGQLIVSAALTALTLPLLGRAARSSGATPSWPSWSSAPSAPGLLTGSTTSSSPSQGPPVPRSSPTCSPSWPSPSVPWCSARHWPHTFSLVPPLSSPVSP
jgi:hypothetical protein